MKCSSSTCILKLDFDYVLHISATSNLAFWNSLVLNILFIINWFPHLGPNKLWLQETQVKILEACIA